MSTTTTVRSVRVVMEADVAGYEAKMRSAGRTTEQAFDRVSRNLKATNRELDTAEVTMRRVDRAEGKLTETTARMNVQFADTQRGLQRTNSQLDTFSGRAGIAAKIAATLGPSLIPVSAVGVPAVAGLVSQLGFATAAGGSAVLAFQGVGDSLKLIERARLDPTVANLREADEAVRRLAPEAQTLVRHLEDLAGAGRGLQRTAAGGFLPGVDDALTALESRLPELQAFVAEISDAAGDNIRDAGESLASDRWTGFFDYLQSQARPQLDATADSVGNLAHGLAELLVATTPLQSDFSSWLRESTEDFDEWATRLSSDSDFREFVAYVRENGPQVAETAGAIAEALFQIVDAAAPLGGPALQTLEMISDIVSLIADSDLGTPILGGLAALSVYNSALSLTGKLTQSAFGLGVRGSSKASGPGGALGGQFTAASTAAKSLRTDLAVLSPAYAKTATTAERLAVANDSLKRNIGPLAGGFARVAGPAAGLAVASTGVADGLGLANTAALGLTGSIAGPWGAAIGAGVGLLLDWRARSSDASQATGEFTATLDQQTGALTANSEQLAAQKLQAEGAFDAAEKLGIRLDLVTAAALGSESAQSQLTAALGEYDGAVTVTTGRGATVVGAYGDQASAAGTLADAVGTVAAEVRADTDAFDQQAAALSGAITRTNELRAAYDGAASAASDLTNQISILDGFLDRRATARAYQASIDALRDSLKDAPQAFSKMGEAGRLNLDNLDAILESAGRHLETLTNPREKVTFLDSVIGTLKQIGRTSPEAADAVREVLPPLADLRDGAEVGAIKLDNADALRKATQTSEALHDLAISRTRPQVDVEVGNSLGLLNDVQRLLNGIDGRVSTATIRVNRIGGSTSSAGGRSVDPEGYAAGGTVGYAAGGTVPRSASGVGRCPNPLALLRDHKEAA